MGYEIEKATNGFFAIAWVILKTRGFKAPVIVLQQIYTYLLSRFSPDKKEFWFHGQYFDYCLNIHNKAYSNERTVEVPIALNMFDLSRDVLEIGNVLTKYQKFKHIVIDKYEVDNNVLNLDILDYNPESKFDLILSVSTFEHIGFDEKIKDPNKVEEAICKAKSWLKKDGRFLMTIPIGYNKGLDEKLDSLGFTDIYYLKRVSKSNQWVPCLKDEALIMEYGKPFHAANAIAVCIYRNY